MKLEVYLYIPFQGQLRFRYNCEGGAHRVLVSDKSYDLVLQVPHYTRNTTCTEMAYRPAAEAQWLSKLEEALAPVQKTLKMSKARTVISVDLGEPLVRMKIQDDKSRIRVYFVRVDD